jgi:hypothetical protein
MARLAVAPPPVQLAGHERRPVAVMGLDVINDGRWRHDATR